MVSDSQLANGLAGYPRQNAPVRWRWQRRTAAYLFIDDISNAVNAGASPTLTLDNENEIVRTLRGIELQEDRVPSDFDPTSDNVALIEQRYIQGAWQDFPLGLYRLLVGQVLHDDHAHRGVHVGGHPRHLCDGADLSYLLTQSGPAEPYTVAASTTYQSAIETILTAQGLTHNLMTLSSTTPLVHTWAPWPETSWHDIIRHLSDGVHYVTPYPDTQGMFRWKAREVTETAVVTYQDTDEPRLIDAAHPYRKGQEIGQLPNVAVTLIDDPRRYNDGVLDDYAFYKKTNADTTSPISTVNPTVGPRGEIIEVIDSDSNPSTKTILNSTTANEISTWALQRAAGEYHKSTLYTLPDPRRGAHEWYTLDIDGIESSTLWRCVKWTRQLSARGTHEHTLTKAIEVTLS